MYLQVLAFLDSIGDSISRNLELVVTIAIPILVFLITQYFGRRRLNSAKRERYNQAKTTLLDILERQIVDNRALRDERVKNLISALERSYKVSLTEQISMTEVYQDLLLRFEESKLDVDDKEEYSSRIENRINEIRGQRRIEDLPSEYSVALTELKDETDVTADEIVNAFEEARAERQNEFQEIDFIKFFIFPDSFADAPPGVRFMYLLLLGFGTIIYIMVTYMIFFQ